MQILPSSIKATLSEAGFSATEILALTHLLGGTVLTLRQLSAKTGKSSGVLDQAIKNLMRRKMVAREIVNDAPHYVIDSLQSVLGWMDEEVCRQRNMLIRRHRDFQTFVSNIETYRSRPGLSHFEGWQNIACAYVKLLKLETKELLYFLPITYKEEEHPLCDFLKNFTIERRQREMFLRILAPDTPLGRRYQSRDLFEYRRTTLVSEGDLPMKMERIIAGETIACFDVEDERACFLHYPRLAESERSMFFSLEKQENV